MISVAVLIGALRALGGLSRSLLPSLSWKKTQTSYCCWMNLDLACTHERKWLDGIRILPTGSGANVATFVALLGTKLHAAVAADGNTPRQRIEDAVKKSRALKRRYASNGSVCWPPGRDIEDWSTPEEYLALYNAALGDTLTVAALLGNDRIVKRIERARGGQSNHGQVAAKFMEDQTQILPTLSDATLARFEDLFKAINKAILSVAS